MSDPYYLRKANLDELDLSKYEKDYSPEELALVKQTLAEQQKQHQESFDKLPFTERAKYHIGDAIDATQQAIEQNPEIALSIPAAATLLGFGKVAKDNAPAATSKTKQVFGSLRDMMDSKKEDGLLANQQAEKAAAEELAKSTPQEASAKVTPKAGTDVNANVGKPLNSTDAELLNKSVAIPENKAVAKNVASAEKAMAEGVSKGLPPPTLTTGTGKPAWAGQSPEGKFKSKYASITDVPEGYAFVKDAQYADVIRGNVGQPTYTSEMSKRPFPTTYKGTPESAIGVSNEINRGLNRPTRDELKAAGAVMPENTKGIFKEISKSKLVKVAGVGGALVALSDLANAATPTEAALRGVDIATDYVPFVAQVKQALTPFEAGMSKIQEESIIANKFKEAQKLGSPYRSVPPPK